jgi:5-methylcytosine-specific restriction endonuclease McrA
MEEQTNKSQAEVKIRKFGERLTDNADANPEPSLENKEGVETRHGLCMKCDGQIPSDKYRNAKYCSTKCRNAYNSYKWRVSKGLIEKPGVGSGGNQLGENNHQYKTGIGSYSTKAFKRYGRQCNRCKSTTNLLVHHINHDRSNNNIENLEVLCKKCHQNHHCIRDEKGRFIQHT